jgi:anti-sigma factor RsiW
MVCKDALEIVEPLASGDRRMDDSARTHFETCPRCAGALASARRLEALLKAVEVPPAPEKFTSAVLQRIHRDRWRSEQRVDRLFNLAIAAAVLLVIGGILAVLNVNAVLSMTASAWLLLREGIRDVMKEAVPTLATYVAAAGLLASALFMWWWAERRLQY